MSNLFEVVDPKGRTVICTTECWKDHIVGNRPHMDTEAWIEEAKNAIEHPSMGIFQAPNHENRNIYYGRHDSKQTRYIKVIVVFEEEKLGYVITAYPADGGHEGERLI